MSVYDSKTAIFNQPMFFISRAESLRAFSDEVNKGKSAMANHPEDYTLFHIGEFDYEKGLLIPLSTPVSMGLATEYIKQEYENEIGNGA